MFVTLADARISAYEIGCESRNLTCRFTAYETVEPTLLHSRLINLLEAKAGFELASFCLQNKRSRAVKLLRHRKISCGDRI